MQPETRQCRYLITQIVDYGRREIKVFLERNIILIIDDI